jgi:hypothetical protein
VGDRTAGAKTAKEILATDALLRKKIYKHAFSLTGSLADATDLSQEAMTRVIDPNGSPWEASEQPNLLLHVGSVMNSLAANRRRAHRRHPGTNYDPEADTRVDPEPMADERIARAEDLARLQRLMDQLLVRLKGDDVALGKIDLLYDEIDDAGDQAARLGCTVNDIYLANDRIAYQVALVKRAARGRTPAAHENGGEP